MAKIHPLPKALCTILKSKKLDAYRLEGVMKFLKSRTRTRGANPKQFDECIYSPYSYDRSKTNKPPLDENMDSAILESTAIDHPTQERRYSDSAVEVDETAHHRREELLDLHTSAGDTTLDSGSDAFQSHIDIPDSFPNSHQYPEQQNTVDFDTRIHTPPRSSFSTTAPSSSGA